MIKKSMLRNNKWRVKRLNDKGKPVKIPSRFLEDEWVEIKDPELITEIFGLHDKDIGEDIDEWFCVAHKTHPYFATDDKYKKIRDELMKDHKLGIEFELFLYRDKGLSKAEVEALTVYEIQEYAREKFNYFIDFDIESGSYTINSLEFLTMEEYESKTKEELKEICHNFGLPRSGNKTALLSRIRDFIENK